MGAARSNHISPDTEPETHHLPLGSVNSPCPGSPSEQQVALIHWEVGNEPAVWSARVRRAGSSSSSIPALSFCAGHHQLPGRGCMPAAPLPFTKLSSHGLLVCGAVDLGPAAGGLSFLFRSHYLFPPEPPTGQLPRGAAANSRSPVARQLLIFRAAITAVCQSGVQLRVAPCQVPGAPTSIFRHLGRVYQAANTILAGIHSARCHAPLSVLGTHLPP